MYDFCWQYCWHAVIDMDLSRETMHLQADTMVILNDATQNAFGEECISGILWPYIYIDWNDVLML